MKLGKVLVVGSANIDLVARVHRAPGPGEAVVGESFAVHPGGKGANQAVAASKLGGEVTFAGAVGSDSFGDQLLQSMSAAGVGVAHVERASTTTGTAFIFVDASGENRIVVVPGANGCIPEDRMRETVASSHAQTVLCQLEINLDAVWSALEAARLDGKRTILNPAPSNPRAAGFLPLADLITPNEQEAHDLSGILPVDTESCRACVKRLRELGARDVVLTRGSAGVFVAEGEQETLIPAPKVVPIDTTGAGDAFSGALSVLWGPLPLHEAARVAVHVASLSTTREGAQPSMLTLQEVAEAFPSLNLLAKS